MTGRGMFALAPGARSISPIRLSEAPAVGAGEHSEPKWYEQLGAWASKFGTDMVSFFNYWLIGLPELLRDALLSEETLSFQHVMNLIGVATILVGTAKLLSSMDDMARAATWEEEVVEYNIGL